MIDYDQSKGLVSEGIVDRSTIATTVPDAPLVGSTATPDLDVFNRIEMLEGLEKKGVLLGETVIFERVVPDPETTQLKLARFVVNFNNPGQRQLLRNVTRILDHARWDDNRKRIPVFLDWLTTLKR